VSELLESVARRLIAEYQSRILGSVDAGGLLEAENFNHMIRGMTVLRDALRERLKEDE